MAALHRQRRRRAAAALALALGVTSAAGCGGGRPTPGHTTAPRTPPDLASFLRLPVAAPASCPPGLAAAASGRRSPWVGHVDVSVFVAGRASAAASARLGRRIAALPGVRHVYFETRAQAHAEFARLYTCSQRVPVRALRASYRVVLIPMTRAQRDALVRRIVRLPDVGEVSCDPSDPCVTAASGG